eukprot:CAMPEP_0197877826 /NCGR_PEP_ID=MMETSP1439-20131203/6406_1 /TAXON_ID=66791 /ORGANISM="Gonyaulax spinifera, Strain CCMP409" /LENGTH=51 /DNA_ID=CAMNT_0043497203 /DNA_START=77 /DNA_END=229 /DNA_ORIENTATION=+
MTLLRRAAQFGSRTWAARGVSTAVVTASQETFSQKCWRWMDITGFLTKWHS